MSVYASRAGEKLAYALQTFHIQLSGKVCADFGSSTGGFVDCLLQHGAKRIYAVETGYGVLDWKLRNNPRVVVLERTNAMHVVLPEKVDCITNDTSWTRQMIIMPNILENLKPHGEIITLIKPHYEAGHTSWKDKKLLHKGVLEKEVAENIAKQIVQMLLVTFPLEEIGLVTSPLLGGKGGNSEYLAYFKNTHQLR